MKVDLVAAVDDVSSGTMADGALFMTCPWADAVDMIMVLGWLFACSSSQFTARPLQRTPRTGIRMVRVAVGKALRQWDSIGLKWAVILSRPAVAGQTPDQRWAGR